jgi:hypothetical protein
MTSASSLVGSQANPTPSGVVISGKGDTWKARPTHGVASNVRITGKGLAQANIGQ